MFHQVKCALLGALLCLMGNVSVYAQTYQTTAAQALLLDAATGTVLYEKNADELIIPASMTKIMTASVVFEEIAKGRLKLDDEMVVSENAWRRGGAVSSGSSMFSTMGQKIKVNDLLQGMLVSSGNDAAMTLAEGIAGREDTFAKLMTDRARELGLTKSTFRNSSGLPHPEQKVTAREMARLTSRLIDDYPDLYRFFNVKEFTWNKVRQQNRNPLLSLDMGADGLQTGNTEDNYGLVGSAVQNGQRLIVVVHGLKTAKERATEARKLVEWGGRSFEARQLFSPDDVIAEARVFGGESLTVPLIAKGAVRMLVPRGAVEKLSARVVYLGPLKAPVAAGTPVGRLIVMRGDVQALDLPLYTQHDVAVGNLMRQGWDAAVELSQGALRDVIRKVLGARV
jgi:serine-type D-Ala-D-Ala carboxypeptidase (penicillin-binding protein 5/6)